MKVRLISYSKSDEHADMTALVAFCARVSNPSNQMNTQTNDKLIKYLIANSHWSPFETDEQLKWDALRSVLTGYRSAL